MRNRNKNIFLGVDWLLILLYFFLIIIGWINIYAVTHQDNLSVLNLSTEYGKQLLWIALSIPLLLLILLFDTKFYEKYASIIYLVSLLLLAGLFLFGKTINGATSWYGFSNFSLQPSEFAKAATALAMARLISDKQFNLKKVKNQLQAFLVLTLPAVLIVLEPDAGSALIYFAFFFVLYREGLPFYYIAASFIAVILFVIALSIGQLYTLLILFGILLLYFIYWFYSKNKKVKRSWLKAIFTFLSVVIFTISVDYVFEHVFSQRHRNRFDVILGKTEDTQNIAYNSKQAMLAISSGGLTGKGFLEGERTKGEFIPEQQTDYIFTTIGEEWGFIGTTTVILLFLIFILRIIKIAERQKSRFSRVYGYSVASIFFFHYAINIGMVIGILPTVGIPLPFFSYGGSALWGFTLLLFVFIKLDSNRIYEW